MNIKEGDIVEVLNLSRGQIWDIESQTCTSRERIATSVKAIVGMRYRVREISKYGIILDGWNHGGHSAECFKESQLLLIEK